MTDAMKAAVPQPFDLDLPMIDIKTRLPRNGAIVLVRGHRGSQGSGKLFICLGQHDAEYRPRNPCLDVNNDCLSDQSFFPTHWLPLAVRQGE